MQWNGIFFHPAKLSEVGTYLLVQHHVGQPMCDTLKHWCNMLETAEEVKDLAEQECHRSTQTPTQVPVPVPDPDPYVDGDFDRGGPDERVWGEDEAEEEELEDLNQYLVSRSEVGAGAVTSALPGSAIPGSYVRVVHSNGLHHIPMVSCHCQGYDTFTLDLFAAQLLPASFKRIKTLFTAQVLDMFQLCNLELKASAYQFYQLLHWLTQPTAPAEVLNLYREFRRMSQLWRWMKKLKWAGYGGKNKNVNDVQAGELVIYCPACPQSGINIPDNWKEDANWQVISMLLLY